MSWARPAAPGARSCSRRRSTRCDRSDTDRIAPDPTRADLGADEVVDARDGDEAADDAVGVAALSASLPWTTFLPEDERAEFFEALTATAAACVGVDTFEPLAHLIEGWRATAEIHANPELAKVLGVPRSGPAVKVTRPKAS
jgi:hypothetical protein